MPMATTKIMALGASVAMSGAFRAPKRKSSEARGKVLTIGDSYSSGVGIHVKLTDYDPENFWCFQERQTTPGAVYARSNGMSAIMEACGGALIGNISSQVDALASKYPQETASGWDDSIIFMTAGGNNPATALGVVWLILLLECVQTWDSCHEKEKNQIANWQAVRDELEALYNNLVNTAPRAKIRIGGYPRLLGPKAGVCSGLPYLNMGEVGFFEDSADELNRIIDEVVTKVAQENPSVDMQFVPVTDYLDEGACVANGHLNGLIYDGWSLSGAAMHPTQKGYDEYLNAYAASL